MEDDISSRKSINDKWLDNIFQALMRLEMYEKLSKEGCSSLIDYVQTPGPDIGQIQYKNYSLFLTEIQIVLNNVKNMLDKQDYFKLVTKLNFIKEHEMKVGNYLEIKNNHLQKRRWYALKRDFYDIQPILSSLRSDLVNSLWNVLSPNARDTLSNPQ